MNNINQLLVQARVAYDAAEWSLLIQCLQELILETDSKDIEEVKCQESLLELALSALEIGDFQQRWEIAKMLTRLGNITIPPLVAILEDDTTEDELRWYAVRILGELKQTEVIPVLMELIQSSDNEELRGMAAIALGQLGKTAILALTELLANDDTKLLATQTLCYIRNQETIVPLLSVAEDSQIAVRAAAIEALSSFHDSRITQVLLNSLEDTSATVRQEAVRGLGFRPELRDRLDLVTCLQAKLYDTKIDVACAAVVSLSRMGCDTAASHLYQVLVTYDTPLKIQIEAIRGLTWIGSISGLEYLQKALNTLVSQTLWQQIVVVIGRVQHQFLNQKATEILLEMLYQNHPASEISNIKSAIALSLGQLGRDEAIETLISLSGDTDNQVRLHAIAALKNLAPEIAHHQN
ncbi:HEAT repeat domain-containing protein [Brunnivagina elsteri]|uniref:HEAT repeat domain-containing protein n=1 Tax=Brunnivagina elsteri TaxID=1247191 RepID=UPI001FE3ADDC|nr:HEAT repeat domain-containing protein [Calothrix elsteri]